MAGYFVNPPLLCLHTLPGAGAQATAGYNRIVRIAAPFLLLFCLAACNRGAQNSEAVRQGVIDYLTRVGLNVAGMDVALTSVQLNGSQADASVSITAKGGNATKGMELKYRLEQKDGKWVVVGRQDSSQHGLGAVAPPGSSPHGGAESPNAARGVGSPNAGGKMPSPEDLPPVSKKP